MSHIIFLPTGLRSRTLGNLCSSGGNILLGVLLPKSLFLLSLTANCEPRFFSWVKSEHRLSSLVLPVGVIFSENRRGLSGERFLSNSSRILGKGLGLPSVVRLHSVVEDIFSSFTNLTLHSEFLREDLVDVSLPRRLAMELLRLGLDTVIIGRLAVDGVGVGGLT